VPVIVITLGVANVTAVFEVKAPATEKLAVGCVDGVPVIVMPLKVSVPLLAIDHAVPVNVTVPAVGAKAFPEVTVNTPVSDNTGAVCTEGVSEIVRPLSASVPALTIFHAVVAIVKVPLAIERPPLTMRESLTVRLFVVVAVLATVNRLKVVPVA